MSYPQPPAIMDMDQALQTQFTYMQFPPIILMTVFILWSAYKNKSVLPIVIYLGGGIAYIAEPLVDVLGLVWFPPNGINAIFESMGRKVPVFGFLAYAWFLGGLSYVVYDRLKKGMTMKGVWIMFGILVVVECFLEIPGLHMGAYTYYGNQPFIFLKFPMWWPVVNATAPMVAGALVYRMEPHVKPILQPIFVYAVCLSNSLVMAGSAMPLFFVLNTDASLTVTHLVGLLTVATACFFVYMVALVAAKDSPALNKAAT